MQSIRQVARLNELELEKCTPSNASWHTDYRDTAYIYIGGLPFELSEGDILTIFSQYGQPAHINLVRDRDTGKSRGFCFLKYEDQRSCDLAVDNLSGASVMGRTLSVDHTRYKKKDGEVERIDDEEEDLLEQADDDTDREDQENRARRRIARSESPEKEKPRPLLKEEVELQKLLKEHDDDDPMKAYLVKEKQAEIVEARAQVERDGAKAADRRRKHRHRHRSTSRERGDDDRRDGHRSRRHREHERDKDDGRRRREKRTMQRSRTPEEAYRRRRTSTCPGHDKRETNGRGDRDIKYRRDRSRTRSRS